MSSINGTDCISHNFGSEGKEYLVFTMAGFIIGKFCKCSCHGFPVVSGVRKTNRFSAILSFHSCQIGGLFLSALGECCFSQLDNCHQMSQNCFFLELGDGSSLLHCVCVPVR